jgi:hypothetical protein
MQRTSTHTTYSASFLPPSLILVMQSPYSSHSSSGESERPSPTTAEGFYITPKDASILKGYLGEFQRADTETRKKILEKAMGEIYALHPPNSAFDKKLAKKVFVPTFHEWYINDILVYHRKSGHGFITIMIVLTANSSNLLGSGQAGMRSTMRTRHPSWSSLSRCPAVFPDLRPFWVPSKTRLLVYGKSCPTRNRIGMLALRRSGRRTHLRSTSEPSELNLRYPCSVSLMDLFRMASAPFRARIVRDFQTQLYKTCGMRSVVLVAYEDKDGNVRASM